MHCKLCWRDNWSSVGAIDECRERRPSGRRLARLVPGASLTGPTLRRAGAIALSLGVLVGFAHGARAQNLVINGDFAYPNVTGFPGGYWRIPSAGHDPSNGPSLVQSSLAWTFCSDCQTSSGPIGFSGVTREEVAGGLKAPAPPDGNKQVGFIQNQGTLSQVLNLSEGPGTLTFNVAQWKDPHGASTALTIGYRIGTAAFGQCTPSSATSYSQCKMQFVIPAGGGGPTPLIFQGDSAAYTPQGPGQLTFIDAVTITQPPPPPPEITEAPSDLYPWSTVPLKGANFWPPPVQVHIKFPNHSEVKFANGSTSEITLDALGAAQAARTIDTSRIDAKYPYGKVETQTVDISVTTGNGLTSSVKHATFHDSAFITSSPNTITPGQDFILQGWNFDAAAQCQRDNRGTVTVHLSDNPIAKFPNQGDNASDTDLVIPIPRDTGQIPSGAGPIPHHGDDCWPDAVKITIPSNTAGVIEQQVEITYQSPSGRKSNSRGATFKPTVVSAMLQPFLVTTEQCSNQSHVDICQTGSASYSVVACPLPAWGNSGEVYSIQAIHIGCWGADSDNGTDAYLVPKQLSWKITGVYNLGLPASPPLVWGDGGNNGTMQYAYIPTQFPTASPLSFIVNWHIGASGGYVVYWFNIEAEGPAGTYPQ